MRALLLTLVLAAFPGCTRPRPPDLGCRDCSLLLVSLDTLRADHLREFGYPRATAPRLSALAAHGLLLTEAFSQSYFSHQSHMSLFTGLYPQNHRVLCSPLMCDGKLDPLPAGARPLAELLREAGFTTFFSAGQPIEDKFLSGFGFSRGVDHFLRQSLQTPADASRIAERIGRPGRYFAFVHSWRVHSPYFTPRSFPSPWPGPRYDGEIPGDEEGYQAFLRKYRQAGGRRFLKEHLPADRERREIWLSSIRRWKLPEEKTFEHFWPAMNLLARDPEGADREQLVHLYDLAIAYADRLLGLLLDELERRGGLDRTLVVVLSDHGDSLWDRGLSNYGHGRFYEEVAHVPVLISHPDWRKKKVPGKRISGLVELVDLFPTLLEQLGVAAPESDGRSLLPLLRGEQGEQGRESVFGYAWGKDGHQSYLRTRDAKLIRQAGASAAYDLRADPLERKELSATGPRFLPLRNELLLREAGR